VIMMEKSAGPSQEQKIFQADHPFIFIIQEKATGNILFIGRVLDPTGAK
jgi:serpin B